MNELCESHMVQIERRHKKSPSIFSEENIVEHLRAELPSPVDKTMFGECSDQIMFQRVIGDY